MPINKLVARIVRDAREQSDRITGEARQKRDELLAGADAEAEERYGEITGAALRSAEGAKKQKVTIAGLDARKDLLQEKQALIQEVFDGALATVRDMPEGEYVELLAKLIVASAGDRPAELILSPRDRERLGEKLVGEANRALEKNGKRAGLSLSNETRDMTAGFIMRSEGLEMNSSIETLIDARRQELEPAVVATLFGASTR
jgi:V/A-type H+/Na+-transporting ATPase subunit E